VPPRASNYCKNIQILGLHVDGAHAKYVVVPAGNVVPLPDGVDFALGAIIADAVATPLRAILSSGVEPGATVAVFGLSGLGLHAAMLLRQVSAPTSSVSTRVTQRSSARPRSASTRCSMRARDARRTRPGSSPAAAWRPRTNS
jgi:D-arabinose 1-dehydrogenase-like Zn-dependent alcohol dehydrogenase